MTSQLDRRRFLRGAGLLAAGVMGTGVLDVSPAGAIEPKVTLTKGGGNGEQHALAVAEWRSG